MHERDRLGLALSGGGFRASFFHLGVLRRLAEFDLLRHLSVLSTVSGGSIIAAHYYLLLKQQYEHKQGNLRKDDYTEIVRRLEADFRLGNRKDLRNLLFMDPRAHFRVIALGRSYGTPIGRLYEKHLYGRVNRELFGDQYGENGVPLHRALIEPPGRKGDLKDKFPSTGYPGSGKSGVNLAEVNEVATAAMIPRLVINATCLNTGGRFSFTHNEVGGPETGYIRMDEVFMLFQYKLLIETMELNPRWTSFGAACEAALSWGPTLEQRHAELPATAFDGDFPLPEWTEEHLRLYLLARERYRSARGIPTETGFDTGWTPRSELVRALSDPDSRMLLDHLVSVDFGRLRRVKIPAWYLLDPWEQGRSTRGGFTQDQYRTEFWRALNDIDAGFENRLQSVDLTELTRVILDFYYFRSAEQIAWDAPRTLGRLTLSRVVAASANFPPVFTPMKIFDLFDATKFGAICLTDGGVHDNQGINALLDDRCNYIVASDAGGLVENQPLPADSRVPMMDRIIDVLMGGLRSVQIRSVDESCQLAGLLENTVPADKTFAAVLAEARQRYNLKRAAVFHITSNPLDGRVSGLDPMLSDEAARIRTDLDEFNDVEVAVLEHAGYQLADRYAEWFASSPDSPFHAVVPAAVPGPLPSREHGERVLRGSRKLAGRLSETYPGSAAVVSLLTACVLFYFRVLSLGALRAFWNFEPTPSSRPSHFVSYIRTLHVWKMFEQARSRIEGGMQPVSILGLVFGTWAAYTLARFAYRSWCRRSSGEAIRPADEQAKALRVRRLGVFLRVRNVISYFCLWMFAVTIHPKWLLGVVPLWSVPFSLFFLFVHYIPRYLWRMAGRLPPTGRAAAELLSHR